MKPYIALVCVDFATSSAVALERGLELASLEPHAEVHLMTVQETTIELLAKPTSELRSPLGPLQDLAKSGLEAFVKTHPTQHIERLVIHVLDGNPAREIVALAAALNADVLVLGTHGRTGIKRAVLGSVSEKVVRTAGCSVIVLRPKAHAEALKVPEVEPPCPQCLATRAASGGTKYWCARHSEHHVHAHVYSSGSGLASGVEPWGFTE